MRDVRAAVELRRGGDEVALRHVADQQDIEQTVVRLRLGREPHGAAVVLAVRDDDVVHPPLAARAAVELDADDGVLPFEEDADERVEERRAAAQRLRHAVRTLRDRRAHADAADVGDVPLRVGAVPGAVRDAADVDGPHDAVACGSDRFRELRRDPVRAHEVHAGADRDRRQLARRPRPDESVHHLVQRAVAADRDDERRALGGRALRQLDQVPGPLGEERLALEPEVRRPVGELGPALPGDAVVRRRVDEEDGAANRRSLRRARRASSGRPRPAAPRR